MIRQDELLCSCVVPITKDVFLINDISFLPSKFIVHAEIITD